ncbi:MAG: DUF1499 domain-containing protein, partial [Paracoccaceae bacterium]
VKWLITPLLIVAVLAAWVRLAPSPSERWFIDPRTAPPPGAAGHVSVQDFGAPADAVLNRLNAIVLASPRTRRLAGSVQAGRITYVTRSRIWGFPDYTSVLAEQRPDGSRLTILGRLRFGVSDSGVNRSRITQWLQRMDARQQ